MKLIQIGTYTPPDPTTYELNMADIDGTNTTRSETGVLSRERVRNDVYKISLSYTNLSSVEVLAFKKAIDPSEISVQLYDGSSSLVIKKMYAGDKKLKLKALEATGSFWDFTVDLIEY